MSVIKDLETDVRTNSPPSFYAELGNGEYRERKAASALHHSRSGSEYGRLVTTVKNSSLASRTTQRFHDENGQEWVREAASASGWRGWCRVYSEPRISAGLHGQSWLATRDFVDFQGDLALGARIGPIMRTIETVDGWLIKVGRRFKRAT